MAHVAKVVLLLPRTKFEENQGEWESRRIEENKKMRRKRARKTATWQKKAVFDKFVIHFHSVSTCFTNFRPFPKVSAFSSYSPHFHPFSALFPFVSLFSHFSSHFQQIAAVSRLFWPIFSWIFRIPTVFETFPLFSPCFPNFSPYLTKKQTEFARSPPPHFPQFQETPPKGINCILICMFWWKFVNVDRQTKVNLWKQTKHRKTFFKPKTHETDFLRLFSPQTSKICCFHPTSISFVFVGLLLVPEEVSIFLCQKCKLTPSFLQTPHEWKQHNAEQIEYEWFRTCTPPTAKQKHWKWFYREDIFTRHFSHWLFFFSKFVPWSLFIIIFLSMSCALEAKSSGTSRDLLLVVFNTLCKFAICYFFDSLCSDFCQFSSLHCRFRIRINICKFVLIYFFWGGRPNSGHFVAFVVDETELSRVYCVWRTRNYSHYSFFVVAFFVLVVREFQLCTMRTRFFLSVRRKVAVFPHQFAGFHIFVIFVSSALFAGRNRFWGVNLHSPSITAFPFQPHFALFPLLIICPFVSTLLFHLPLFDAACFLPLAFHLFCTCCQAASSLFLCLASLFCSRLLVLLVLS